MNLNRVMIAGNLCRDPELRWTPSGLAVCEINVAVNHKYKTSTGETKDEVAFIGCTAFGNSAENLAAYLKKGANIFVEGRIKTESWEDKESGSKRQKTKIQIESWQFGSSKAEGNAGAAHKISRPAPEPKSKQPDLPPVDDEFPKSDDDVPF